MSIAHKVNGVWQETGGVLPVDAALSSTSVNAVQNKVITQALGSKVDSSDLGTAATKNSTTSVTSGSTDLVTSGAVYTYVDTMITSALNAGY